jgi:hypothetical protein
MAFIFCGFCTSLRLTECIPSQELLSKDQGPATGCFNGLHVSNFLAISLGILIRATIASSPAFLRVIGSANHIT